MNGEAMEIAAATISLCIKRSLNSYFNLLMVSPVYTAGKIITLNEPRLTSAVFVQLIWITALLRQKTLKGILLSIEEKNKTFSNKKKFRKIEEKISEIKR